MVTLFYVWRFYLYGALPGTEHADARTALYLLGRELILTEWLYLDTVAK